MTRMTWDGVRALDFLAAQRGVDAGRLGIIGHSLGAKEVLYVAAFDDTGEELAWWRDRTVDTARELARA